MRILHTVQLYHPTIGGSEEVVKQLSERLTRRGHQVTVATKRNEKRDTKVINGVGIKEFDLSGNAVNGFQGDIREYQKFLREGKYDIMMNYAAQIWSTDLVLPILDELPYKKILVPCGYPALKYPKFAKYFKSLPIYLAKYNRLIYLSPNYQDKQFGEKYGLKNGVVIPNAASEDEFTTLRHGFRERYGIKTKYMLLTVANHYPAKGHGFVIDAWKRLKRKDVTLVIIGDVHDTFPYLHSCYLHCSFASARNKNVRILRNVSRNDVIAAYTETDVFVFGSSIECSPLVIFEAMAAGTPFVTTNCGSVNDLREFGHIINTPKEMTQSVQALLDNPENRAVEGQRARQEWLKHYTWERITDQYEELYKTVLNE